LLFLTECWERRVAPGLYSVRGELLTDMPAPLAMTPVHLRIAPD
jgi:hypothetical protein